MKDLHEPKQDTKNVIFLVHNNNMGLKLQFAYSLKASSCNVFFLHMFARFRDNEFQFPGIGSMLSSKASELSLQ